MQKPIKFLYAQIGNVELYSDMTDMMEDGLVDSIYEKRMKNDIEIAFDNCTEDFFQFGISAVNACSRALYYLNASVLAGMFSPYMLCAGSTTMVTNALVDAINEHLQNFASHVQVRSLFRLIIDM